MCCAAERATRHSRPSDRGRNGSASVRRYPPEDLRPAVGRCCSRSSGVGPPCRFVTSGASASLRIGTTSACLRSTLGAGLRFGVSRLRLPGGVSSEPCPGASFVSPADQPTERLCRARELAASSSGWLRETECRGIPLAMPWGVACCAVRPTERQRRSSAQNGVARLHGARTARPVPD